MNYIEVKHPHGFLIWKGKQESIAADKMLPADEEMLLVCNNEAYGKLKLAQPTAVNLTEFERLKDEHCIRPEERKMMWPDNDTFYLHRVKELEPFAGSMPVIITNGQAEFVSQPEDLSQDEAVLVQQAEKLPKTIILSDAPHLDTPPKLKPVGLTVYSSPPNGTGPISFKPIKWSN